MSKDRIQTEASKKASYTDSTDQQDIMRSNRTSLKTLQRVATDKENLTGRSPITVGKPPVKEIKIEIKDQADLKRKKINKEKSIQTGPDNKIQADDLTSDAGPSEHYWQVLAEKRGEALAEALEENQELHEKIKKLEEENLLCKEMLEDSKNMVEILTEMIDEQESGIDMAEASTLSLISEEEKVEEEAKTKKEERAEEKERA